MKANIKVQPIILAAGKGSRMKSKTSKVLCKIANKPMIGHILEKTETLSRTYTLLQSLIVVGYKSEDIIKAFPAKNTSSYKYIEQKEQLGTGHAIKITTNLIDHDAIVVVLYGDVPLIESETICSVINAAADTGFGLLTVKIDNPSGYGRIIRSEKQIIKIVEQKDASPEEQNINEVNTGILAAKGADIIRWVDQLSNNNSQNEYYLTDIVALAVSEGYQISSVHPKDEHEVLGANDPKQLAALERAYQLAQAEKLIAKGAYIADPHRVDIRGKLTIGAEAHIDINTLFEGDVIVGDRVNIEPNCIIRNSTIGNDCQIKANSYIESATIGNSVSIGPFARIREDSVFGDNSKIGNFVETKKATLGKDTKVNHLSYIGDAKLGNKVNIGAGTITCNYDGKNKHQTLIEDEVFIGSNSALIAPIKIGKGATVAAGSTLTKEVKKSDLAVGRANQKNIQNWKKPKDR